MIIRVTLKDPDGVYESIKDACACADTEDDFMPDVEDMLHSPAIEKWIEWSEYVRIEIDTEAGTAVVLPVKRR